MNDLENRVRCLDWIDIDNKMWLVCPEYNGIFCVDKQSNTAHHEIFFNEYPKFNSGWWYLSLLKAGENIVCVPFKANHINIYSLNNHKVQSIQINEDINMHHEMYNLEKKYYRGYVNGNYVILSAYDYPSIIYFNVSTYQIYYITNWFDNKRIDIYNSNYKCYFGDGIVQMKDEIYLPVNCFAAILILNLKSMKTQLKYLECDSDGYEGITLNDNYIYLVSRKSDKYYLVIWNIENNFIKEIGIPFHGLAFDWISFLRPLYFDSKIYLIPATATHFYIVDLQACDVKIAEELECIIAEFPQNIQDFKIAQYEQNNNHITFHTWWDYKFHEYNLETGERRDYEIRLEDERYWQHYRNDLCEKMIQDGNIILEGTVTLNSFLEVVSNIHNNIAGNKV